MNTTELIAQIFEICIIPLLGILTSYLVMFIKNKTQTLKEETNNELYHKYMNLLQETITSCVIATNQTYVESLKNRGAFDKAAQEEAFKRTFEAVMNILSLDAVEYLNSAVGDLNTYIIKSIEAQVNMNKSVDRVKEVKEEVATLEQV